MQMNCKQGVDGVGDKPRSAVRDCRWAYGWHIESFAKHLGCGADSCGSRADLDRHDRRLSLYAQQSPQQPPQPP